jgi:hypothetical protein
MSYFVISVSDLSLDIMLQTTNTFVYPEYCFIEIIIQKKKKQKKKKKL